MVDGWTTIPNQDEYERIATRANAREPVLIDGRKHIVMEIEFDSARNRGRYKAVPIEPPRE